MKFVITGEHWGDPASFRLNFKIKNDDNANPLQLAGGSHVLFEEVRLMASGTEIERITNYGRIHELFRSVLMSSDFNANEAVEDGRTVDATLNPPTKAKKIGKGQYLSVSMQPLLGFLASGKYVPLRYCPLELSRIAGVFVTFVGGTEAAAANQVVTKFVNPSRAIANGDGEGEDEGYGLERDLKIAVTLGSKQWPKMSPASSQSELFSLPRQAVNIYDTGVSTVAINSAGYSSDKFCAGIPTAIIPGQPFSSVSSRSGDLLSCRVENMGANFAKTMHITLLSEQICGIREGGVTSLE
jgi:hypothetical protein